MSLEFRKKHFSSFKKAGDLSSHELVAIYEIDENLLDQLRFAAVLYLSKSIDSKISFRQMMNSGDDFLRLVDENLTKIKNITPNGMVVPKRIHLLEYNLYASTFMNIIESIGISDQIDSWVNPPNLRFKEGLLPEEKLKRNFASEHIHSESWIELNGSKCISIFIPLLGDIQNNFVEFYTPPADFSEEWMKPQASYAGAKHISDKYQKISMPYEAGKAYLTDCSVLHATNRNTPSGPRLSIDLNFLPKSAEINASNTELKHERLKSLGKEKLFVFHDSLDEFSDTAGGKTHPSAHRTLIEPFHP